jgi:hypothetical protein
MHIGDSRGIFPFTNLVHSNESLPKLKIELRSWISDDTSVQVAICIKVFGRRVNGTTRILALMYQRDCPHNPEQTVEFFRQWTEPPPSPSTGESPRRYRPISVIRRHHSRRQIWCVWTSASFAAAARPAALRLPLRSQRAPFTASQGILAVGS